jgi:hypothetical protein
MWCYVFRIRLTLTYFGIDTTSECLQSTEEYIGGLSYADHILEYSWNSVQLNLFRMANQHIERRVNISF